MGIGDRQEQISKCPILVRGKCTMVRKYRGRWEWEVMRCNFKLGGDSYSGQASPRAKTWESGSSRGGTACAKTLRWEPACMIKEYSKEVGQGDEVGERG
jgi:hypothetical protein